MIDVSVTYRESERAVYLFGSILQQRDGFLSRKNTFKARAAVMIIYLCLACISLILGGFENYVFPVMIILVGLFQIFFIDRKVKKAILTQISKIYLRDGERNLCLYEDFIEYTYENTSAIIYYDEIDEIIEKDDFVLIKSSAVPTAKMIYLCGEDVTEGSYEDFTEILYHRAEEKYNVTGGKG